MLGYKASVKGLFEYFGIFQLNLIMFPLYINSNGPYKRMSQTKKKICLSVGNFGILSVFVVVVNFSAYRAYTSLCTVIK